MNKKYYNKDASIAWYETLGKDLVEKRLKAIQSKKLTNTSSLKRATTKFTKLRDCGPGGELIIGEGDSAVSGLIPFRDPEIHAILPLRGVIPNALTMEKTQMVV